MDIEQARDNMIKQQLRAWEVLDERVLEVIKHTPREAFVANEYRKLAFADTHISIGYGETMMLPMEEARMLQALAIQEQDNILEIGTGSAYITALLAKLGQKVTSIEIHSELYQQAQERLNRLGMDGNATLVHGDGITEHGQNGPYDVIAVTGSSPLFIEEFRQQLKPGGRLFIILGTAPVMEASLFTLSENNQWSQQKLFETLLPTLQNAPQPPQFKF